MGKRLIGYFPTYSLGNIHTGQLIAALAENMLDWQHRIAQGGLEDMKVWLTKSVHSCGNLYDPADLIRKITGKT